MGALCLLAVFFGAQTALAYPNPDATYPDGVERTDCVDCHGADPVATDNVRKGPHGNFQVAGASGHRVPQTNLVPGGHADGTTATVTFSGAGGTLMCTDCHSLRHDAAPGTGYVRVFDEKHDDVSGPEDGIHAPCTTCHVTDLLSAHADKCAACRATPYDTLEPAWEGGCQQGGCHPTYHEGPFDAHWEADDENRCDPCHSLYGWDPTPNDCLNCHASPASATPPMTTSDALATYEGAARALSLSPYSPLVSPDSALRNSLGFASVLTKWLSVASAVAVVTSMSP